MADKADKTELRSEHFFAGFPCDRLYKPGRNKIFLHASEL